MFGCCFNAEKLRRRGDTPPYLCHPALKEERLEKTRIYSGVVGSLKMRILCGTFLKRLQQSLQHGYDLESVDFITDDLNRFVFTVERR